MPKKDRKIIEKDGKRYTTRGVELTHASQTLTTAEFWSFILGGLRKLTKFWKPKLDCLKSARRPYTGLDKRTKWEYTCAICKKWYKQKDVEVDHIIPIGGLNGPSKLATWVERAFVEIDGYQVLCKPCHLQKSKKEKQEK